MGRWHTYFYEGLICNLADTGLIQNTPGVYVIYGDDQILYIGQSSDVGKRILNHRIRYSYSNYILTPWGKHLSIKIKVSYSKRYGDWAMRELRLIKKIQPPHNCVFSTKKRVSA